MKKPKLIIVEGSQGSGKTTVTNYLRENITSTNLFRLSGCKSDDLSMPYKYHKELLETCVRMGEMGVDNNIVFDRSYLSEWIYRILGYKNTDMTEFNDYGWSLSSVLNDLTKYYNVILVPLYVSNNNTYIERLMRDKPTYNTTIFSVENSIIQEDSYIDLCEEIVSTFTDIRLLKFNSEDHPSILLKLLEEIK